MSKSLWLLIGCEKVCDLAGIDLAEVDFVEAAATGAILPAVPGPPPDIDPLTLKPAATVLCFAATAALKALENLACILWLRPSCSPAPLTATLLRQRIRSVQLGTLCFALVSYCCDRCDSAPFSLSVA